QDCVAVDGGYTLFIKQFESFCKNKNIDLNDKNFFYPIRKETGIPLNKQEEYYNRVFGSFRIVFLLKDIQNFVNKFNIIEQEQHKIWINDNSDFPNDMRLIDIVYTNQMEQIEKIKDLNKIQMDIDDNNNDHNDTDIDFPEYHNISKERKRRSKNKNKSLNIYEYRNVQKIVNHKIENKRYMFYVKWKGYQDGDNSWVHESDFKQKQIIIDYFNEKNILYTS
ncbi:hypothetical protein BDB00DRAFT_766343, partial [Zychaea mexicana]|uniref:uncharacterized protein n=1 Tax=Zychaea mexicana TaxID=64656 RepID=UPI0022FF45ED